MKKTSPKHEGPAAGAQANARDRVRKHREMLRANGLRPIQIWVPDTRQPGFQEELDRQCVAVNGSPGEKEALDFIEHAMDYSGWV